MMLDTRPGVSRAAHAVGVVHRDIKPANIFLHRDRSTGLAAAKILDFGISKFGGNDDSHATKTGAVLGSPRYMSPEQTRSAASVDARADLWAAGVILFEGLTGHLRRIEGEQLQQPRRRHLHDPSPHLDRPDGAGPARAPSAPSCADCLKPARERLATAAGASAKRPALRPAQIPSLATIPLPRPLHPPSESIKTTTGVRVRPPLLTTTGSPESLRTTQSRGRTSQPTPQAPADDAPVSRPARPTQTLARPVVAPSRPSRRCEALRARRRPSRPPPRLTRRPSPPAIAPVPFQPQMGPVPIYVADDALLTTKVPVAPPPPTPPPRRAVNVTLPIDTSAVMRSPVVFPVGPPAAREPSAIVPAPAFPAPAFPAPAFPAPALPVPLLRPSPPRRAIRWVGTAVSRMNLTTHWAGARVLPGAPGARDVCLPRFMPPAPVMLSGDKGLRFMAPLLGRAGLGGDHLRVDVSVIRTTPGTPAPAALPSASEEAAPLPPPLLQQRPRSSRRGRTGLRRRGFRRSPPPPSASAAEPSPRRRTAPGTSKAPGGRVPAPAPHGTAKPVLQVARLSGPRSKTAPLRGGHRVRSSSSWLLRAARTSVRFSKVRLLPWRSPRPPSPAGCFRRAVPRPLSSQPAASPRAPRLPPSSRAASRWSPRLASSSRPLLAARAPRPPRSSWLPRGGAPRSDQIAGRSLWRAPCPDHSPRAEGSPPSRLGWSFPPRGGSLGEGGAR